MRGRSISIDVHHSAISVRRARPSDAVAIIVLASQQGNVLHYLTETFRAQSQDVASFLSGPSGGGLIAERAGRPCGTATFVDETTSVTLFRLVVAASATPGESDDIARALVGAVESLAREIGAAVVCVQTSRERGNVEFFERLGYRVEWEEKDVSRGELCTGVELAKALS